MILSQKEIQQTVNLLKRIEPGYLPVEIFYQFARLYVTPIIELVPIKKTSDGEIKILTVKRSKDDPHWPGMLHTPGTVLRSTDKTIDNALERIVKDELSGIEIESLPIFVDYAFHAVKRGKEIALVFYIEYKKAPEAGEEINPNSLPRNIVNTQIDFIKEVVSKYESNNN